MSYKKHPYQRKNKRIVGGVRVDKDTEETINSITEDYKNKIIFQSQEIERLKNTLTFFNEREARRSERNWNIVGAILSVLVSIGTSVLVLKILL